MCLDKDLFIDTLKKKNLSSSDALLRTFLLDVFKERDSLDDEGRFGFDRYIGFIGSVCEEDRVIGNLGSDSPTPGSIEETSRRELNDLPGHMKQIIKEGVGFLQNEKYDELFDYVLKSGYEEDPIPRGDPVPVISIFDIGVLMGYKTCVDLLGLIRKQPLIE